MGVIESEEAAKRLARVIVSDIEIYNKDKFHTGADLTAAIEEGRALFRSRVAPELVPVFTSVLEDRRASRKKTAGKTEGSPPAAEPAKAAPRAVEKIAAAEPIVRAAPAAVEAPAPAPVPPAPVAPAPIAPAPAAPVVEVAAPTAAAPAASAAPAAATTPAARSPSARGGIIDTEEAAARLARVILSDVELYNAKKIAAGLDLTSEIDEGRHLFKSRVSGELHAVFETALANKGLGQRKRALTPAPRTKPPVVEAAPPAPAPAAAAQPAAMIPARPGPAAPSRPQVSAVNAPPALLPRPGLAPAARPAGAPHAVSDAPSARHSIAASATPAATPTPVADRGSARQVSLPPGRVALATRTPEPTEDESDLPTPMPGGYDDVVAAEPMAPAMAAAAATPRMSTPRMPATPPPVPARASAAVMRAVGAAQPAPPVRRERTPSVSEFPVHVESGPIRHEEPPAGRPSQAVIDALPDSGPLHAAPAAAAAAPPPTAPLPVAAAHPEPALPALPAAPRVPTPPSVPLPAPIAFAPVPTEAADGEVVSLRRRTSPARVVLTLAALAGAGGALWYFFLR